jgi:hypothetical protein
MDDNEKENRDDGRVVANMNVEGMPWYSGSSENKEVKGGSESQRRPEPLSRRETLQIMLAAMKWALIAALALSAVLVLFTLFCTQIWFRVR